MSTKGSSTTTHGSQLRDAQQLTTAILNQSWMASQVVIREAIKAYGSSITTGPERLIRYSAEGFTTDTVAAMTDLIESVMNMNRMDNLLNAADKIAAFHPKWQKLKDLESLWLGGHGDVQLTSPGTHYSTRQKAFEAVTSEFERYEQFAMAQCLDEYSKRPGPKIERKQDQDGSIKWADFESLRTVLQTILPEERRSKVAGALSLFSTSRQSELRRKALAGVIDATRDDANPLTEAEAKLYDFV